MPGWPRNTLGHPRGQLLVAVGHEDVRELVIDQGEGPALLEIEMLAVVGLADGQQAGLAQHAVRIADVIDRRDGVFAGDEPEQIVVVGLAHAVGQPADHLVQLGHGRRRRPTLSGPVRWAA